ncbi:MAG: hypothetical protein GX660_13640, partial [Clostridiaceae bacterium]|nr:hypothetical protein [Clostridiaceae bacterium]
ADVTALIDASGNIVVSYCYDPFGNILESTGTVKNPIRYAGYQYDEESGLYYLNARMYDPRIARFLQEDTYKGDVSDPLSLNLYTYCHNEPIMYWDPTGHEEIFLTDWLEEVNINGLEWNSKTKTASVEFSPSGSVRNAAYFTIEDGHVSVVVGQNNNYTTYSNVGYVNPNFDKIVLYDGNNMPGWLGSMKRNEPPSKKEWDYYEPFIAGDNISNGLKNDILYGENAIPYSVPSAHLMKDMYIYQEKWLEVTKQALDSCGVNDDAYRERILKEYNDLVENYRALGIAVENWSFVKNETYYRFGLDIFKNSGKYSIYILSNREVQKDADRANFAFTAMWSMKLMDMRFQNPNAYYGKDQTIKYPTNDPNKGTGNAIKLLPEGKVGNFAEVKNIRDFMSRVPSNAERLPWTDIPGGAKQGIKYKWTDAQGNKWQVRAHEMDPSAPNGSNASSGWIYRVEVNPKNVGGKWFMDSSGNFHKENIIRESSPFYNPNIANDTHIPFLDR